MKYKHKNVALKENVNISFILLVIYSSKCMLNAVYVPDSFLEAENTINKTNKKLVFMDFSS